MDSSLVSVLLPSFNAGKNLIYAVSSILNQSHSNLELIVIDDASTDDSIEQLKSISDNRLVILKQSANSGYPTAMNAGLAMAKGDFIARMDADDVSEPTRLAEQLNILKSFPQASFCGVVRYRITPGGKRYVDKQRPKEPYRWETWDDLVHNTRLFTDPSVMIEKKKVLEVGGYRTFQRSGMDVDLWLRVMERFGACITLTVPLFGKRLEPGSLVFKAETPLINQVPRALALQRKANNGIDDVIAGRQVNLEEYVRQKYIQKVTEVDQVALFLGAAVTCLTFFDWKGTSLYLQQSWRVGTTFSTRIMITYSFMLKVLQRVRNNPFIIYKE
jgi:glycosyltransferase involved in cell wall biosynthesis